MNLLDPTNDYVFKVLFKDPDAERRLIAMLTAVLEPKIPIRSATVLDPEILPDLESGKAIVLDLRVELADGSVIGVEMETTPRRAFAPRFLFYWARNHSQQLTRGATYTELRPTIGIAWTGGLLTTVPQDPAGPVRMHSRYRVRNVETHAELTNHLELHVLELPKLDADGTLSPALRRWARFFAHPSEDELIALAREDEIMAETVDKLREVSADERHRQLAESRLRNDFAYRAELASEREEGIAQGFALGRDEGIALGRDEGIALGRDEGFALGRDEGIALGRDEGIALGRDEGIALGRAKLARAMLERGVDRATVADALGVAESELEHLVEGR